MIKLLKLNREIVYLNPFLIKMMEITPDTVITMMDGSKYIVAESAEEVAQGIKLYYRELYRNGPEIIPQEQQESF